MIYKTIRNLTMAKRQMQRTPTSPMKLNSAILNEKESSATQSSINLQSSLVTSDLRPEGVTAIQEKIDSLTADYLGLGISGFVGADDYTFTAGFVDTAKTKPFTENTIVRIASDSKLISTVAFLRLLDKGKITGFESLKTYLPAFGNTQVINPVVDVPEITLPNPLSTENQSAYLNIYEKKHDRQVGQTIAITGSNAVGNLTAETINKVFVIAKVLDKDNYQVLLNTVSASNETKQGGAVTILALPSGTKKTTYKEASYYYTTVPLKRDILIWHILNQTIGYQYLLLGSAGGYEDNRDDPKRKALAAIQGGIYLEKAMPMICPVPAVPGTFNNIREWCDVLASVPLLFQPGEEYTYGPGVALLGALIEVIDGRSVEAYVKAEVTGPLGMNDTGFFIQDNDPARTDKLSRIQQLTIRPAPGVFVDVAFLPGLGAYGDYFYGSTRPRSLSFMDAGMYSTLSDRNKFYKMLLNNGKYLSNDTDKYILSPATVSLLSHNCIGDIVATAITPSATNFKWGLGVAVAPGTNGGFTLAGQSKHLIFWSGAFGSLFVVDWANASVLNFVVNSFDVAKVDNNKRIMINMHMSALANINANDENVSAAPLNIY